MRAAPSASSPARARSLDEIQGQYMGLSRFTPAGWRGACEALAGLAPEQLDALSMTAWLSRVIAAGGRLQGCPYSGLG